MCNCVYSWSRGGLGACGLFYMLFVVYFFIFIKRVLCTPPEGFHVCVDVSMYIQSGRPMDSHKSVRVSVSQLILVLPDRRLPSLIES